MTDLFISYSSHDRPWAEQLFKDFQRRFPTIKVFWDRNPASIPPGEPYRQYFERGARDTSHFVVFWSAAAFASPEVNPEIQAFLQNVQTNETTAKKTKRRPFYISNCNTTSPMGHLRPIKASRTFKKLMRTTRERIQKHPMME